MTITPRGHFEAPHHAICGITIPWPPTTLRSRPRVGLHYRAIADAQVGVEHFWDSLRVPARHATSPTSNRRLLEIFGFVPPAPSVRSSLASPIFPACPSSTVNEALEHVQRAALRLGIRTVQIHGDHSELPPIGPSVRFIPAFGIRDKADLERMNAYIERLHGDDGCAVTVLVDAHVAATRGAGAQPAVAAGAGAETSATCLTVGRAKNPNKGGQANQPHSPYGVSGGSGGEGGPGLRAERLSASSLNARAAV